MAEGNLAYSPENLIAMDTSGNLLLKDELIWDKLEAYWSMDDVSGSNVYDSTDNNYDGVQSNVTFGSSYGKHLNGALFNGSNSQINVSTLPHWERTQAYSVSSWVKRGGVGTYQGIIQTTQGGNGYGSIDIFFRNTNYIQVQLMNTFPTNNIILYFNPQITNTTNWYHILVTYDGSSTAAGIKCYVNGTSQTVNTLEYDNLTSTTVGTGTPQIGRRGSVHSFNGNIDEIGLWSRVLPQTDVTKLYNSGDGKFY